MEEYNMRERTDRKLLHMHGVGRYMFDHAEDYGLEPDKMYVLGLLHDIGYLFGSADHAVNGARLLESVGFNYSQEVSWHGTAPLDYLRLTDVSEPPKELVLLWEADLSVGPDGKEIGFQRRLEDIAVRYGTDSINYRIAKETVDWLTTR